MIDDNFKIPVFNSISTAWSKVSGVKAAIWGVLLLVIVVKIIDIATSHLLLSFSLTVLAVATSIIFSLVIFLLAMCRIYLGIRKANDFPVAFAMIKDVCKLKIFLRAVGIVLIYIALFIIPCLFMFLPDPLFQPSAPDATHVAKLAAAGCYITGVILFIVAYFYALRFFLSYGFVIVKNMGTIEAIKTSYALTKGNVWRILWFYFLSGCILMLSAIPLGIGLIWTLPYMSVAYGVLYQRFCARGEIAPMA